LQKSLNKFTDWAVQAKIEYGQSKAYIIPNLRFVLLFYCFDTSTNYFNNQKILNIKGLKS